MDKQPKGFTLLEIIVVVIILGILASLAFVQYSKVVEKSRTAEAKSVLGQIRKAQLAYYEEYESYANDLTNLTLTAPASCQTSNYFSYSGDSVAATATRCTSNGKSPNASDSYTITLNYDNGSYGGSAGYY